MATEEVMTTTPTTDADQLTVKMQSIADTVELLTKSIKTLTSEFKFVQKEVTKLKSKGRRSPKKPVDPDAPRKENSLEKPVVITDELCEFLGLTKGEKHSRQTVTKTINQYVKEHDLQNPENRRFILLESEHGLKLKALLRDPDQPLTFFNIQRYLKPHYVKETSTEVPVKEEKVTEKVVDKAVVEEASATDAQPVKKVVKRVVRKTATPVVEVTG